MDDEKPHPSHKLSRRVAVIRFCRASQMMLSASLSFGRSGKFLGVPSRRIAPFFGHGCCSPVTVFCVEMVFGIGGIVLVAGAVMWVAGDIIGRRARAKNAAKYGRQ